MFTVVGRVRLAFTFAALMAAASPLVADPLAAIATQPAMPDSVQLSPEILVRVQQMLAQSATFRSQFRRIIERPRLVLHAAIDPLIVDRSYRARSTIRRYDSGLVVVAVSIGPGPHVEEFIAHEFEHVLEHLEGVDLAEMARRRRPGVWFSGPGTIETSRATRAGRAVTDEMRGHGSRSDNLVQ